MDWTTLVIIAAGIIGTLALVTWATRSGAAANTPARRTVPVAAPAPTPVQPPVSVGPAHDGDGPYQADHGLYRSRTIPSLIPNHPLNPNPGQNAANGRRGR